MRLIDANFVLYAAESEFSEEDAANVRWLISRIPTIDAEPVRHGRWIEVDRITWRIGDGDKFDTTVEEKCSNCGCYEERYETERQENYCPTCGAKMIEVKA